MTDFTFYTTETAPAASKAILEEVQKGYGFIPNLFAYMAEAPGALEAYLSLNEIIGKTSFTAAQQQVALLAGSVENDCDFCATAHHAMGKMNKANDQTLNALRQKQTIDDTSDAALAKFTQTVVRERGHISDKVIEEFLAAGFTKQNVFEVMIIISIKTLSNYTNHITKPEANAELLAMI